MVSTSWVLLLSYQRRFNWENNPKILLCVDYWAFDSMLPPVVKAHSKAEGFLSLVTLPKIDRLCAVLIGSTVNSPLDCTSGYDHLALSP